MSCCSGIFFISIAHPIFLTFPVGQWEVRAAGHWLIIYMLQDRVPARDPHIPVGMFISILKSLLNIANWTLKASQASRDC